MLTPATALEVSTNSRITVMSLTTVLGSLRVTKKVTIKLLDSRLKSLPISSDFKLLIGLNLNCMLLHSVWPLRCLTVGVLWHYKTNSQPSLKEIQ